MLRLSNEVHSREVLLVAMLNLIIRMQSIRHLSRVKDVKMLVSITIEIIELD